MTSSLHEQLQRVFVVVPAYREEARLGATLEAVTRLPYEVIVVDDGSGDGTAEVAARHPVWVVRHSINRGQGAALQTGIDLALRNEATAIVTFDADGQHDPEDIESLLGPVLGGEVDVCLGSRFRGRAEGMPFARRVLLAAAVAFTRVTSGLAVTDTHNGLRALSRRAAEHIRIQEPRMAHASEILDEIHRHRLSWVERAVTIRYTPETLAKGQSAMGAIAILSDLLMSWLTRRRTASPGGRPS